MSYQGQLGSTSAPSCTACFLLLAGYPVHVHHCSGLRHLCCLHFTEGGSWQQCNKLQSTSHECRHWSWYLRHVKLCADLFKICYKITPFFLILQSHTHQLVTLKWISVSYVQEQVLPLCKWFLVLIVHQHPVSFHRTAHQWASRIRKMVGLWSSKVYTDSQLSVKWVLLGLALSVYLGQIIPVVGTIIVRTVLPHQLKCN